MALIRPYSSTEPSRSYRELLRNYRRPIYGYTTAVRIYGDPWSRDKLMSSSKLGKLVGIHP